MWTDVAEAKPWLQVSRGRMRGQPRRWEMEDEYEELAAGELWLGEAQSLRCSDRKAGWL